MNSKEIQNNVQAIVDNFSKEEFIYDLLMAYGTTKTVTTMLKKGDYNLSKVEGEVLSKNKVFFKVEESGKLLSTIDTISKEDRILKHKPKFAILTDYKQLVAKDLRFGTTKDIQISELANHHSFFLPLAGSEVYNSNNDNEADRDAAYKMAEVYDELRRENPEIYKSKESIHHLNIFLSRLLFCFFAEDTEIFDEESIFTNTLAQHTNPNGSDTHVFLNDLFKRLNTEKKDGLPDYLIDFPYVNGGLFKDPIKSPKFSSKARKVLLELGDLDWKDINPDIFGSMIQAVVIDEYRSDLGMHYTSVPNILKVIKPLFLDELYEEYEKHQNSIPQLRKLINRISKIKFFDPACGSGNFLIITYKEIRVLEVKILKQISELTLKNTGQVSNFFTSIQLNQFYGIELDDFAHEMAILSLWLAEHQMNKIFDEKLADFGGESKDILPLKEAGQIVQGNATRENWKVVCPIDLASEVYIIGNPPYLGYSRQDEVQKKDMEIVFSGVNNYKKLDYIACWFYKATNYIENTIAKYAFVTTNSITQGEQVALLWPLILNKQQEIDFAHQSFKWTNNAKGNAGVAVVIIGIRNISASPKYLFNDNLRQVVKNISPYLSDTVNVFVKSRTTPLSKLPPMIKGSSPGDNGNLLLDTEEKEKLIVKNSNVDRFIKKYIGAQEFIKGSFRFCIHITEKNKDEACEIEELNERFNKVKEFRLKSKKKATQKKALTPYFFDEDKHQKGEFILVPQTSSELREYIPIGYFDDSYVPSNGTRVVYNAQPWLFGVISSKMHMVWTHSTAGRLETRIQYTNTLCYNTFPFPDITTKQKEILNQYVFDILDERAKHTGKTMAWLYNPDTMPKGLKQAHKNLDEAIEKCYRLQEFKNDTERLEYLFKFYETMVQKDTLFAKQKKTRKTKSKK